MTKLKKDLLQIVNVREFSNEADYVDPSLSFIIPQVIKNSWWKIINKFKIFLIK